MTDEHYWSDDSAINNFSLMKLLMKKETKEIKEIENKQFQRYRKMSKFVSLKYIVN